MDEKLAIYFLAGRQFKCDTSADESQFSISKIQQGLNSDGYEINLKLIIPKTAAEKAIADWEDLNIKEGEKALDRDNLLFLENAYTASGVASIPPNKKVKPVVIDNANLILSAVPSGGDDKNPLKLQFNLEFAAGGKTKHGSFKTKHGE